MQQGVIFCFKDALEYGRTGGSDGVQDEDQDELWWDSNRHNVPNPGAGPSRTRGRGRLNLRLRGDREPPTRLRNHAARRP